MNWTCGFVVGSTLALTMLPSPAKAQSLIPGGTPDVIFTCYQNAKPASVCALQCAFDIAYFGSGPIGKPTKPPSKAVGSIHPTNVSRIELYSSKAGRTDTRSWIAYKHKTMTDEVVQLLYMGPNMYCDFNLRKQTASGDVELRVEQFNQ